MLFRRSSRSAVAVLTAVLLFLFQTAVAAQACAHSISRNGTAATMPCHEPGANEHSNAPSTPESASVCEAGKAVGQAAHTELPAAVDLPAVLITYVDTATYTSASQVSRVVP